MSTGLERIRQVMADHLKEQGVPAVTAWPGEARQEREEPVVVVSLRRCRMGPAGFQNYLGERYDEETGRWEERYGRRAELVFGLDIYAPERGGGEGIQQTFDALAGALLLGGPEGMDLRELSCGETVRDPGSRRLVRPAEAVCAAWLRAVTDSGGVFTDFELRGVVTG